MALTEAQQGISLPTIVLIDEKYYPSPALFTLLQSLKFLSAEMSEVLYNGGKMSEETPTITTLIVIPHESWRSP